MLQASQLVYDSWLPIGCLRDNYANFLHVYELTLVYYDIILNTDVSNIYDKYYPALYKDFVFYWKQC